jgi:hypothetical protein
MRTARNKLNAAHINGALIIAAVLGALTGSWWIFGVTLGGLLVSALVSGEIRLRGRR